MGKSEIVGKSETAVTSATQQTTPIQQPKHNDQKIQRYKDTKQRIKTPKNLRKQFLIGVTHAQRTKNKRCTES
jgi:hypothetical protein